MRSTKKANLGAFVGSTGNRAGECQDGVPRRLPTHPQALPLLLGLLGYFANQLGIPILQVLVVALQLLVVAL